METCTIDALRQNAETVNAAATERDSAVLAEQEASATVLQAAIDLACPSLRAIGTRLIERYSCVVDGPGETKDYTDYRYVCLSEDSCTPDEIRQYNNDTSGVWDSGPVLAVDETGVFVEVRKLGQWSRWQHSRCEYGLEVTVYSSALDAVRDGWADVESCIARLAALLEKSGPGLLARTVKATERAVKLGALAVLLRK